MSTQIRSSKRTIARLAIIVLSLIITARLAKQTYELLKVRDRLLETESKIAALESETEALESELEHKKSNTYIEKQIRDTLRLSRPEDITIDVGSYPGNKQVRQSHDNKESREQIPIWQQWWALFTPQMVGLTNE